MRYETIQNLKIEDNLRNDIYQANLFNKEFDFALNVVIILKSNLDPQEASAQVVLFILDLGFAYDKII